MLNQFSRLSLETEGRYAASSELQFIKDYLATVDHRVSAYEKIRDAEYQIMYEVTAQVKANAGTNFQRGDMDMTVVCQRDCGLILRCAAAAMLIDDLDRLRDGLLLWQQTIINAGKYDQISQAIWKALPQVVKQYLSPEEAEIVMPVLRLNQALLN